MSASKCIGRVGSLAAALGVGVAVFSSAAIASADPGAADSVTTAGSNATGTASPDATNSVPDRKPARSAGRARTPRGPASAAASATETNPGAVLSRSASPRKNTSPAIPAGVTPTAASIPQPGAAITVPNSVAAGVDTAPATVADVGAVVRDRLKRSPAAPPAPQPFARALRVSETSGPAMPAVLAPLRDVIVQLQGRAPIATAAPAAAVAAPAGSVVSGGGAAATDKLTPGQALEIVRGVAALVVTVLPQLVVVNLAGLANFAPPSPMKAAPTLVLNGYNLNPRSPQNITGMYGRWTYLPGGLSMIQGTQTFDVVDPATDAKLGTFDAIVSRGNGYNYQELLVTANDGINVGTDAGQTPPVGSLISTLKFFKKLGWSYSAMPTGTGQNLVSFTFITPFGDFPVKLNFDAAEGIADHTVDNRPMDLMNGYFIAPADPTGEVFTGVSGVLPLFTTVQGHQKFNIVDSNGLAVGSFDGLFTTTKDLAGMSTQAVLVTANDGINVGTGPGQTPPVGSVYNIIYSEPATYIYAGLPSASGNVITLTADTKNEGIIASPITLLDAVTPPASGDKPLTTPDGYRFVATSPEVPTGVNGLPPREVQYQGYQQFDVYDSAGTKVGSVDADVYRQWDVFGISGRAIMITKVTSGTAGTDPGNVPPVGSIYNFVNPGKGSFGTAHSTVAGASGDISSYMVKTPLGNIKFPSTTKSATDRVPTNFYTPF